MSLENDCNQFVSFHQLISMALKNSHKSSMTLEGICRWVRVHTHFLEESEFSQIQAATGVKGFCYQKVITKEGIVFYERISNLDTDNYWRKGIQKVLEESHYCFRSLDQASVKHYEKLWYGMVFFLVYNFIKAFDISKETRGKKKLKKASKTKYFAN